MESRIVDYIEPGIVETLKAHPGNINNLVSVLYENCFKVDPLTFTHRNNARERISGADSRDFIEYILSKIVTLYGSMIYDWNYDNGLNRLNEKEKQTAFFNRYLYYNSCYNAINVIRTQEDPITYYQINRNELFELINIVVGTRFDSSIYQINNDGSRIINSKKRKEIDGKSSYIDDANQLLKKLTSINIQARDIQFYDRTINRCLVDVLNGNQFRNKRNEYALDGTLYASQDIGRKRDNQEDSVIILTHPDNPDFKLLAVADGMGGQSAGEIASSMVIKAISNWFMSLPKEMYYNKKWLEQEFQSIVKATSKAVAQFNKENNLDSGSTFTGAIVANTDTIIAHVGDSRAYTIKNGTIKLQTPDQSVVWPTYRKKDGSYGLYSPSELSLPTIDDLRFRKNSNGIYNHMGFEVDGKEDDFTKVHIITIKNKEYDKLLIMSDGVSDLLSSEEIAFASRNVPPSRLTSVLVDKALSRNAKRFLPADSDHVQEINAGKDNASVVAYIR